MNNQGFSSYFDMARTDAEIAAGFSAIPPGEDNMVAHGQHIIANPEHAGEQKQRVSDVIFRELESWGIALPIGCIVNIREALDASQPASVTQEQCRCGHHVAWHVLADLECQKCDCKKFSAASATPQQPNSKSSEEQKIQGRNTAHAGLRLHEESGELLRVVQAAYLKHHVGKDDVGWEELATMMQNALCNAMGDRAFCAWLDKETQS